MLSRKPVNTFIPHPAGENYTLEQKLAHESTHCGTWLKIVGFLLANVMTNTFSLDGAFSESVSPAVIVTACVLAGLSTIYANFISKTVVASEPTEALRLNASLQRLYDRLNARMKINKELHHIRESALYIFADDLARFDNEIILIDTINRAPQKKLYIILQMLADKYGTIYLIKSDQPGCRLEAEDQSYAFYHDSSFEGMTYSAKILDAMITIPRWLLIKGLPSLVLINQGIATTVSLLNRIPRFSDAPWYVQIGAISTAGLWLTYARVNLNNRLKGNRAIYEAEVLRYKAGQFFQSHSQNSSTPLRVSRLQAGGVIAVGLLSIGFTTYYNFATAYFYSPQQSIRLIDKQLDVIPGIENAPDCLNQIANVLIGMQVYLHYSQLGSSVVLGLLTSCKSTLDRIHDWLYKNADHSSFHELPMTEKLFRIANIGDSLTFAVNAGFNSQNTIPNVELSIATGSGIFATNVIWGLDTKNMEIAKAILGVVKTRSNTAMVTPHSVNFFKKSPELRQPLLTESEQEYEEKIDVNRP